MKKIGFVENIKGVNGGVIVSDLPAKDFTIAADANVEIGFSAKFAKKFTVKRWKKSQGNSAFVLFNEITSKEQAQLILEKGVYADEDKFDEWQEHIPEGDDIEGYQVFDIESNKLLGRVAYILISPAHSIISIKNEAGECLIPFTDEFIKAIDDDEKQISVKLIDGMLNLNTEAAINDE